MAEKRSKSERRQVCQRRCRHDPQQAHIPDLIGHRIRVVEMLELKTILRGDIVPFGSRKPHDKTRPRIAKDIDDIQPPLTVLMPDFPAIIVGHNV
jgi:hypothetical protein